MKKFTYYHCYAPDLWDGYEKNGLIRGSFGIRFSQSQGIAEELKFNTLAKKGGKLYNYVKENKCAFYVDRLQGGVFIDDYEYDMELVNEYKNMLGEKFLGFQMHEWLSNYRGDVQGKLGHIPENEWTEDNIEKAIKSKFPYETLFLEAMTLEEMAKAGKPTNYKQFYDNMTAIYKKRAKQFDIVPCDSYYMMYPFEAQNGAKIIMPEVGAQISDMRMQMCFARGVCSAYGIKLGAYYEPWGGDPFTCCSYEEDGKNEWNITNSDDFPFVPGGPNGGSSRSLQFRVHLYAYLSGAEMISEEWGGYNTFKNRKKGELSEYGEVKKMFLDFVDKYPDIGEKVAPIAVVLPNDFPCLCINGDKENGYKELFGYPIEGKMLEMSKIVNMGVNKIFRNACPMLGNEAHTLINSPVPDAVDMLNEGDGKALEKYKYLVNFTGDKEFENKHHNCISEDEVVSVLERELPCKITGNVHFMINRAEENGYYLSIFNHSGIERTQKNGERILENSEESVEIELKDGRLLTVLEGKGNTEIKDGKYCITLGGGEWLLAKI